MLSKVKTSMTVKILRSFMSPLTNRLVEVDSIFNVPKNRFWLKRCLQKDCKETNEKPTTVKPAQVLKLNAKDSKKGSK